MQNDEKLKIRLAQPNKNIVRTYMVQLQKSSRITVSLPRGQYQQLHKLSAELDVSVSWLVRRAVTEFLGQKSSVAELRKLNKPGK